MDASSIFMAREMALSESMAIEESVFPVTATVLSRAWQKAILQSAAIITAILSIIEILSIHALNLSIPAQRRRRMMEK